MGKRLSYTVQSIERALDIHRDKGRIVAWSSSGNGRYLATLNQGDLFELRSLREAYVFVVGLATAGAAEG